MGDGWVNSGGLSVKHAAALAWQCTFRKQSRFFDGLCLLYYVFFYVSFLIQISTLCQQNRMFVNMLYFLKIAV